MIGVGGSSDGIRIGAWDHDPDHGQQLPLSEAIPRRSIERVAQLTIPSSGDAMALHASHQPVLAHAVAPPRMIRRECSAPVQTGGRETGGQGARLEGASGLLMRPDGSGEASGRAHPCENVERAPSDRAAAVPGPPGGNRKMKGRDADSVLADIPGEGHPYVHEITAPSFIARLPAEDTRADRRIASDPLSWLSTEPMVSGAPRASTPPPPPARPIYGRPGPLLPRVARARLIATTETMDKATDNAIALFLQTPHGPAVPPTDEVEEAIRCLPECIFQPWDILRGK